MAPEAPAFAQSGHQGAEPDQPGTDPGYTQYGGMVYRPTVESIAQTLVNMMTVWTVFSIIMSAIVLLMGFTVIDTIYQLYGETVNPHFVYFEGFCLLFSGLATLVSAVLTKKAKWFWLAVAFCVAAGVLSYFGVGGFLGIMTMVVGFYVSLGVYRCKPYFKS